MKIILRFFILPFCFFLWTSTVSFAADDLDNNLAKWQEIHDLIQQYHVSAPTSDQLTEGSIQGMLDALHDPFTDYFTDQQFENFMNSMDGQYSGIGMVVRLIEGDYIIQQVFKDSPAEKAGILAGDQIIAIDGLDLIQHPMEDAAEKIKGVEGTKVQLKLQRADKNFQVDVTRQKIELPMVESKIFDGNIGYLELAAFSHDSMKKFSDQLQELQRKNIQGLIVDLRDNPGGLLSSALKMSSLFLKEGPIVHVKDRNGQEDTYQVKRGVSWNIPLVLLVNENSASASEIVTAALKDYEMATIIGTRTYGKGTVQELHPLQHGGVLKLTIEEYFSPMHQTINHVGIQPHLLITDPEEQLQAALYVLHKNNQLTLTAKGETQINGEKKQGVIPAVRRNGDWYLAVRPLAYLFQGQVHFDREKKEAQLTLGSKSTSFSVFGNKDLFVEKGTSYLSLKQAMNQYPSLKISKEANGDLILSQRN